jgi:hypothetical protein
VRPAALLVGVSIAVAFGSGASATTRSDGTGLKTLPGLEPPELTVTHPARGTAPGYVFVAEKYGHNRPGGPVIADDRGRVVWYHQLPSGIEATDFRTQTYRGKPVLTWWQGIISIAGIGRGMDEIYDSSYRKIRELHAGNGLQADLHEFELTPRGTAYITAYKEVPADLSTVGGPSKSYVLDSVVQELDVATGKVVFEWRSLDHVPLSDSKEADHEPALHATKKRPLDYFHVNSVTDGPDHTILISARNTSTIYLLARDGHIVWRIGTAGSDFGPASAVRMHYQHDARLHSGNLLSFFDNGGIPREEPYSRPTVLKLDFKTRTAKIVRTFVSPKRIASPFEGNLQLLPDGGAFVGWGGFRRVTEFGPGGKVRFELKLPFGDSYRGYRLPWDGDPGGRPSIAVADRKVYASWNGKLGIAHWQLLAGANQQHLRVAGTYPWQGIETAMWLPLGAQTVAVRALNASGAVLGSSSLLSG